MTATEFRAMCEAIYGDRPVVPMMADLGVSRRTIERWFSGQRPVSVRHLMSIKKTKRLREIDGEGKDA